jgi:hypothetical protein
MSFSFAVYRSSVGVASERITILFGLIVLMLASFAPTAHAAVTVGATSGSHQVSPSGAFTYTIPIAVPPGTAGIEPKLSLSYNSQGGNGLLGMGWSLAGLSVIHRCPRTMVQDGVIGGVNYNANDRYCLDGQRLIAITGTYGADAAEYRTESESYSRIVSYGSQGSGPAWWKVWTKSGQILEYGNTADSRIEAQGKTEVMLWSLNKLADTVGNYLTVSYIEDNPNGQYYPDRIDYTGNSNAGKSPTNSVRLVYEARPDLTPMYQAGSVSKNTVRLKSVQSYVGSVMAKEYTLTYEQAVRTQRTRLTSVVECSGSGVCLPATVCNSLQENSGNFTLAYRQNNYPSDGKIWRAGSDAFTTFVADVNGDGRSDLVQIYNNEYRAQVLHSDEVGNNALASVSTGLGVTTSVTYAPLTNNSVYAKDSGAVYPYVDIQFPLYVVSSVTTSDGIGGTYSTDYTYAGAKSHLLGGGFLGFRQVSVHDPQAHIRSTTTYRQDYPYQGQPLSTQKLTDSGILLGQSLITYSDQLLNTGISPTWHQSLPTHTVESSYELTGGLISTVVTDTQYDVWGNPTSIAVDAGGGYSKTTTHTYDNIIDANRWFLGRLRRSTVTSVTP